MACLPANFVAIKSSPACSGLVRWPPLCCRPWGFVWASVVSWLESCFGWVQPSLPWAVVAHWCAWTFVRQPAWLAAVLPSPLLQGVGLQVCCCWALLAWAFLAFGYVDACRSAGCPRAVFGPAGHGAQLWFQLWLIGRPEFGFVPAGVGAAAGSCVLWLSWALCLGR